LAAASSVRRALGPVAVESALVGGESRTHCSPDGTMGRPRARRLRAVRQSIRDLRAGV